MCLREEETPLLCWWQYKLVQPLWKAVWRLFGKLKIELPCDPAIPLLGVYQDKTVIQRCMHPYVHSSAIYSNQDVETTYVFIRR